MDGLQGCSSQAQRLCHEPAETDTVGEVLALHVKCEGPKEVQHVKSI